MPSLPTSPALVPPVTDKATVLLETDVATVQRERAEAIAAGESRNLLVMAAHHIALRVGWIFKTESVIMPAFMDAIAGGGWVRGCLPILNRFGQSVPPLLLAERVQQTPLKKRWVILTTWLMATPFLLIAGLWWQMSRTGADPRSFVWLAPCILVLYTFFFSVTGVNVLSFGTLQGKLIRANLRGKLVMISGSVGAVLAIAGAWWLLRVWLAAPDGGFDRIFGTTALGFVIAGAVCLAIREPRDESQPIAPTPLIEHFRRAGRTVRDDAAFRKLVITAMLFITTMLLFPHYQALGRTALNCEYADLLGWLIAQNAGAGVFSLFAGTIADRCGNRLPLRLEILGSATTPLVAVGIACGWLPGGRDWYWVTFFLLGLTPLAIKTLTNYTLELAPEHAHARYLSTLKLAVGVPIVLSPLFGWLIDVVGFVPVFLTVSVTMLGSGMMTFWLPEPRYHTESAGEVDKT